MQKEQLLELRNKIVQATQDIALQGEGNDAERLQVLLNIARAGNANYAVLQKAYELASSIEGDDDKLAALLDILFEVDVQLAGDEGEGTREGERIAAPVNEAVSQEAPAQPSDPPSQFDSNTNQPNEQG